MGDHKKRQTKVPPRLLAVAAGRMNLPFIEKTYERSLEKQKFGFIHVKFEICTRHPSGYGRRHLDKSIWN